MGLLHRDEPVADATVNCPSCFANDWVVRASRLGGQAKIVCRACGHDEGDYFPVDWSVENDGDPAWAEQAARDLERAGFAVYVPAGLPWRAASSWSLDDEVHHVTVASEEPWVVVVSERAASSGEMIEALHASMEDVLAGDYPPRGSRSIPAYQLEILRRDERIEAQVADLAVQNGTLRVDGADVPCKLLAHGGGWAAYLVLGDAVVIASATSTPIEQVELVRHG